MLDLVRRGHSLRTVANSVKAMIMVGGDPDVLMRGIMQHAGLNDTCAVGLIHVGHTTDAHQHICGVLNLLARGVKQWWFWPPTAAGKIAGVAGRPDEEGGGGRPAKPNKSDPSCIQLTQREGQVIWIPPGWWHEVYTEEGEHVTHAIKDVSKADHCVSWVTWAWPLAVREGAVAQWAMGWVVEKQSKKDVSGGVSMTIKRHAYEEFLVGKHQV